MESKDIKKLQKSVNYLIQRVKELSEDVGYLKADSQEKDIISKSNKIYDEYMKEMTKLINDKSMNQLRADIIEKAKKFLETNKTSVSGYNAYNPELEVDYDNVYSPRHNGNKTACRAEFIIVKEKSKVIVLLKGIITNKVYARGIAKCMPDDVFNEHIGKAIALGRALGLDVSEFENAVQPNEVVVGQIVGSKFNNRHKWKVNSINDDYVELIIAESIVKYMIGSKVTTDLLSDWVIFDNDTDAKY